MRTGTARIVKRFAAQMSRWARPNEMPQRWDISHGSASLSGSRSKPMGSGFQGELPRNLPTTVK